MSFSFRGSLPGSKSLFIRALIAASYADGLEVAGNRDSEDIELVDEGLSALTAGGAIECGDGGAVLRFLALRASRVAGEHVLVGSERLFSRPLSELQHVLSGLGVATELGDRRLVVRSPGWDAAAVSVDCSRSSQFASGLLVNCWGLDAPLTIELENLAGSGGYWEMTLDVVRRLGMEVHQDGDRLVVPPHQPVTANSFDVEVDMGCAFAVSAVAAVAGKALIEGFPSASPQPDARFVDLLATMGVPIDRDAAGLRVGRAPQLTGLEVDLGSSPDLFPVLGALAGCASGPSDLGGAPQLRYKESDRIAKVAELVRAMGRRVQVRDDGIEIADGVMTTEPFSFDADHDHRMAMAAAVAHHAGAPVTITGGDTVDKSFGSFWDIVGWRP